MGFSIRPKGAARQGTRGSLRFTPLMTGGSDLDQTPATGVAHRVGSDVHQGACRRTRRTL